MNSGKKLPPISEPAQHARLGKTKDAGILHVVGGEVVRIPRMKNALLSPRNGAIYAQLLKGETSIWLARVWGAKIRAVQKIVPR